LRSEGSQWGEERGRAAYRSQDGVELFGEVLLPEAGPFLLLSGEVSNKLLEYLLALSL